MANYIEEVTTRLDQALRFPLVDSPKFFPSQDALLEESRKLREIESDAKLVEQVEKEGDNPLPEGPEKDKIKAVFRGVSRVLQVRNAICRTDDTGTENDKMGLFITLGAHPAAKEITPRPPETFPGIPGVPPAPPPPPPDKMYQGIVRIQVTNGGQPLYAGKPSENSQVEMKYDPTKPLFIVVTEGIPGKDDVPHRHAFDGNWAVIRDMIKLRGGFTFGVGPAGRQVRFNLNSKSAIPVPWPKRSEFPLKISP
jgi:hypothetical protein